jgi:hypothetical protein
LDHKSLSVRDRQEKGLCIIWKRQDWSPEEEEDDIVVSKEWELEDWQSPKMGVNDAYSGDHTINLYSDLRLDNWCGKGERPFAEHDIKVTPRHFAKAILIDTEPLTDDSFKKIIRWAYAYPQTAPVSAIKINAPPHIETDFELALLRYLRNYLYGLHGYSFQNEAHAACFSDLVTRKRWTQVEKKNLEFLKTIATKVKALDEKNRRDLSKGKIKFDERTGSYYIPNK